MDAVKLNEVAETTGRNLTLKETDLYFYKEGFLEGAMYQEKKDVEGLDFVKETYHTAGYEFAIEKACEWWEDLLHKQSVDDARREYWDAQIALFKSALWK